MARKTRIDTVPVGDLVKDLGPVADTMGQAMVPLKPSTEMLAAGAKAGDVSIETVYRIYRAMVTVSASSCGPDNRDYLLASGPFGGSFPIVNAIPG